MTGFLSARQIRIFDYRRFAEPLRDRVRERAAELASAAGIAIEHIAKNYIRKEDVVARVLVVRGDHPGLVHIISAMEACDTYKPSHDKHTHRTFLRPDTGKWPALLLLLHRRRVEPDLSARADPGPRRGRLWCPFRLQFYCNGHSWLARQLTAAGVGSTLGRQRLSAHRRLGARAGPRRHPPARPPASHPRSLCPAVLSGARRLRAVLPLEFHAGRGRHRSGVPLASHPKTPLRTAFPASHPHRYSRTSRPLPYEEDHSRTP